MNKKIECINASNFDNLTEGTVYEVISESKDLFTITNDIGIEARYHRKYFQDFQEKPKILPPVFHTRRNGQNLILTIEYGTENNRQGRETVFSMVSVSSSCGVVSYYGVNDLFRVLEDINLATEEYIQQAIEAVLGNGSYSMVLFSTNMSHPLLVETLNNMANFCSEQRRNPNSTNLIQVWGFYTSSNE